MGSLSDRYYDYLNHYDDDMCVSCGDEERDPDSIEGQCFTCMVGEDE